MALLMFLVELKSLLNFYFPLIHIYWSVNLEVLDEVEEASTREYSKSVPKT